MIVELVFIEEVARFRLVAAGWGAFADSADVKPVYRDVIGERHFREFILRIQMRDIENDLLCLRQMEIKCTLCFQLEYTHEASVRFRFEPETGIEPLVRIASAQDTVVGNERLIESQQIPHEFAELLFRAGLSGGCQPGSFFRRKFTDVFVDRKISDLSFRCAVNLLFRREFNVIRLGGGRRDFCRVIEQGIHGFPVFL